MFCARSCLPLLTLQDCFVVYANTNITEKRFKILRSQQEISELPEENEHILRKNMLDSIWVGQMKSFKMENLL